MGEIKVGDIVARKSYGGDTPFTVAEIVKKGDGSTVYVLEGMLYRITADASPDDLIIQNQNEVYSRIFKEVGQIKRTCFARSSYRSMSFLSRLRSRPGRILHVDSSREYLDMCMRYYREAGIRAVGQVVKESGQPEVVGGYLRRYQPDILIVTGHDGLKKNAPVNSIDSYYNSRYYIQSVKEARRFQPNKDKLCIFAGACQSYFEAIMAEGANFASSPGRILIHALDPGIICQKIALTDSNQIVRPEDVVGLTVSGAKGVGGIDTRGQRK